MGTLTIFNDKFPAGFQIQIAGRIDTYRPEAREELDPLNELPLSTLEDLVAFKNVLAVDKKKCEALVNSKFTISKSTSGFYSL
jgi:hypothetical protein